MSKLFIPILLGTSRPKRHSHKVAKLIEERGKTIQDLQVQIIDPLDYNFPFDGNDEENKDPRYTQITAQADGFFIVTPEYNHSFPGTLKRMLDSELTNYIHKPVALAGVSDRIFGGVRAIESLLPALRELGLVPTFADLYFPEVQKLFDQQGTLTDASYKQRIDRAYEELIWMAKTLKYGRENNKSIYHTVKK
jgi:NAD(P)H-dependent FMN reductase